MHGLLTLKCHNFFQSLKKIEKTHTVLLPDLKLQKSLKFNDICMSWSSPKIKVLRTSVFLNSNFHM